MSSLVPRLSSFLLATAVLFLGVGGLAGCGSSADEGEAADAVTFEVDPARLGARVPRPDLGVQFHPPRGWTALPDSVVHVVRARMAATMDSLAPGNVVTAEPLAAFGRPETGAVLTLAALRPAPNARGLAAGFDAVVTAYRPVAEQQLGPDTRTARFRRDGMPVVQFLAQTPERVHFRLLVDVPAAPVAQFDYIVPRARYADVVRLLEASIGSIERLDAAPKEAAAP